MASMYIRVKRLKTTTFLQVEPTDTISSVKAKLEVLLQQPPEKQQLYKDGALLEDSRSLAELRIETDDILALALKQPDDTFESPQIIEFDQDDDEDGDGE